MTDNRFLLPIRIDSENDGPTQSVLVSVPTILASDSRHVVLGSETGDVFIFGRATIPLASEPASSLPPALLSPKGSPHLKAFGRPPSPALSSSSKRSSSSFNTPSGLITGHARAVSNLSKEPVEAPKNYVDFDDEPAKLRIMLNSQGAVHDRTVMDVITPHFDSDIVINESPVQNPTLNATVESPSSAPSPNEKNAPSAPHPPKVSHEEPRMAKHRVKDAIELRCHVLPARSGPGEAVAALTLIKDGRFFISLQESGRLSLHHTADGLCLSSSSLDGPPRCRAPQGFTDVPIDARAWTWQTIQLVSTDDVGIIMQVAASDIAEFKQGMIDALDDQLTTRIALIRLYLNDIMREVPYGVEAFELLGEWSMVGPAVGTGLVMHHESITFWHLSAATLSLVPLSLEPRPSDAPSLPTAHPATTYDSVRDALHSISSLTKPFRNHAQSSARPVHPRQSSIYISGKEELAALPASKITSQTISTVHLYRHNVAESHTTVQEVSDPLLGEGAHLIGACASTHTAGRFHLYVIWSSSTILTFAIPISSSTNVELSIIVNVVPVDVGDILDVRCINASQMAYLVIGNMTTTMLRLVGGTPASEASRPNFSVDHAQTMLASSEWSAWDVESGTLFITAKNDRGHTKVLSTSIPTPGHLGGTLQNSWNPAGKLSSSENLSSPRITSLLPLGLDIVLAGYDDGFIRQGTVSELISGTLPLLQSKRSLNQSITGLHSVLDPIIHVTWVVGATNDGCIAVWNASSLELRAKWTLFCEPLRRVISFADEDVGRLKGCMLCVSADGTIAVIALERLEFLYLIPGSIAPLEKILVGVDNLLLCYRNSRTRLWDMKSLEFWRSMGNDQVFELLDSGGWYEEDVEKPRPVFLVPPLGYLNGYADSPDAGQTLFFNLLEVSALTQPPPPQKLHRLPSDNPSIEYEPNSRLVPSESRREVAQSTLRSILNVLLTFGLDSKVDAFCQTLLGTSKSTVASLGSINIESTALYGSKNPHDAWSISSTHTAYRLLALVIALRSASHCFDDPNARIPVITSFYVSRLTESLGESFKLPSLAVLARYLFDGVSDVRFAARALFESAAHQLDNGVIMGLFEAWKHELPCVQLETLRQSPKAALALILLGNLTIQRFALVSPDVLTNISKSITVYLHDDASPHRATAIELCSRGFDIWQHYVDPMNLLRAIFRFTVTPAGLKEDPTTRNLGHIARSAVLQIAESNTPLFMSTISLDIMDAKSVEHRSSTMQLVAFIIRKKPLVLYPNLPRLIEAVVKSLDPNRSAAREGVLDSAIEFFAQVVRTYPNIDFHTPTQRLAVGITEGAIVMYDLKTASRLYVLEGHRGRVAACTFSPDGHRLVSVSLEECMVLVWKVGTSFASFFSRGGGSGGQPYKTFPLALGELAHMPLEETFLKISFEWPAPRSARLKIVDSVFTFAT